MKIIYQKRFQKQLQKLQKYQKVSVADTIDLFCRNPHDASLKNHALQGAMKGMRSLTAGFDLRIIFEERDGYAIIVMIAVGTHQEVY
jgi:addiction module RelE/StbE family toxin